MGAVPGRQPALGLRRREGCRRPHPALPHTQAMCLTGRAADREAPLARGAIEVGAPDAPELDPFDFTVDDFEVDFIREGREAGMAHRFAADLTYRTAPGAPEQKRQIITYITVQLQNDKDPGGFNLGRYGPVTEGLAIFGIGITILVFTALWIAGKS